MSDPLSITASIAAVLQLTSAIATYLKAVYDAPQERISFLLEISGLESLLDALQKRVDQANSGDPWLTELQALGASISQFESHLKRLASKLEPVGGLNFKEVARRLKWKFNKTDVEDTLAKIERMKSLIIFALTNNIL